MKTYFTGEFRARRPLTVVTGLAMMGIGGGLAVVWISHFTRVERVDQLLGLICGILFVFFWFGGGVFLLQKAINNQKTTLAITSEGITYGQRKFCWNGIAEMGVMQKYAGRRDLYLVPRTGGSAFNVELPVSKGLNPQEIEDLFKALADVLPYYAHVRLAG